MSAYLVKTSNFVAEIATDDELIHLATVGTIHPSTLIKDGNKWKQASEIRILQKIWGIEKPPALPDMPRQAGKKQDKNKAKADKVDKDKTRIKPKPAKSTEPPPPPKGRPPRLDTVVDFAPARFTQLLEQLREAEEMEGVQPVKEPEIKPQTDLPEQKIDETKLELLPKLSDEELEASPKIQNIVNNNSESDASSAEIPNESEIGTLPLSVRVSDEGQLEVSTIEKEASPDSQQTVEQHSETVALSPKKVDEVREILDEHFKAEDKDKQSGEDHVIDVFTPNAFAESNASGNSAVENTASPDSSTRVLSADDIKDSAQDIDDIAVIEENANKGDEDADNIQDLSVSSIAEAVCAAELNDDIQDIPIAQVEKVDNTVELKDENLISTMPISVQELSVKKDTSDETAKPEDPTKAFISLSELGDDDYDSAFENEKTSAIERDVIFGKGELHDLDDDEEETHAMDRSDAIKAIHDMDDSISYLQNLSFSQLESASTSISMPSTDNLVGISLLHASNAMNPAAFDSKNAEEAEEEDAEDSMEIATTIEQPSVRQRLKDLGEFDDHPSEMFTKHSKSELRRLLEIENSDDDDHPSEKFSTHSRSELKRLAKLESAKNNDDELANLEEDYSSESMKIQSKIELNSLFAEQNEINLILAHEIETDDTADDDNERPMHHRPRNSQQVLAEDDDEDETQLDLRSAVPANIQNGKSGAVSETTNKISKKSKKNKNKTNNTVTKITSANGKKNKNATQKKSKKELTFSGRLFEGELEIARYQNMCLTTHRLWSASEDSGRIKSYESYDLSAIQWVRLISKKQPVWIVLCILSIIVTASLLAPQFIPALHTEPIADPIIISAIGLWACIMFIIGYMLTPKSIIQIGLASEHIDIPATNAEKDKNAAIEFLNKINSTRFERCK